MVNKGSLAAQAGHLKHGDEAASQVRTQEKPEQQGLRHSRMSL